jgi:hypothetical protein
MALDDDKENVSPTVLMQQLKSSVRMQSPSIFPSRRSSVGKPLSPSQAKQIVLKALGPSPTREALATFANGLNKDERRLFLGDSRNATPMGIKMPSAMNVSPRFRAVLTENLRKKQNDCSESICTLRDVSVCLLVCRCG